MRLTDHERAVLREAVARHFGPEVRVQVFGSRVREDARGGDIDLYLDLCLGLYLGNMAATAADVVRCKVDLLLELHDRLGDQRIDIVVRRPGGPELPIHLEAEATGVPL